MSKQKLVFAGLGALILVGVTVFIPAWRRSVRKKEYDALITQPLVSVRNGATRVSIGNRELLHAIAADQRCIDNLSEITFSSITLDDRDQLDLKKLHKVSKIGFYCCKNVDAIIPTIRLLPLDLLWFEIADVTPEALETIRHSNSLKEIGFEQNLTEAQVRILKLFPATIKITSSFPLDAHD